MSKKRIKAKKLKAPLWQDLTYMAFVMVAPIVITCIELFQSHSTPFKIGFASVGAILVAYIVIKKYVLNSMIEKIKTEIGYLEHDYAINCGDEKLIVAKWKSCQMKIYLFNAITVILAMVLLYMFVTALADGLIAFRGAAMLILLCVVLGMIFKICTYIRGVYVDLEEETSEETK